MASLRSALFFAIAAVAVQSAFGIGAELNDPVGAPDNVVSTAKNTIVNQYTVLCRILTAAVRGNKIAPNDAPKVAQIARDKGLQWPETRTEEDVSTVLGTFLDDIAHNGDITVDMARKLKAIIYSVGFDATAPIDADLVQDKFVDPYIALRRMLTAAVRGNKIAPNDGPKVARLARDYGLHLAITMATDAHAVLWTFLNDMAHNADITVDMARKLKAIIDTVGLDPTAPIDAGLLPDEIALDAKI